MANLNFFEIECFFLFFLSLFYISWYLLQKKLKSFEYLSSDIQIQFASRVVSNIHSFLVLIISIYILFTDDNVSQKIM